MILPLFGNSIPSTNWVISCIFLFTSNQLYHCLPIRSSVINVFWIMKNGLIMLMCMFSILDPPSSGRIKRRHGGGSTLKDFSWLYNNEDMLAEVFAWLPQHKMIQIAAVSRRCREIIISDGFRSLARAHAIEERYLLGLFPKCSTDKPEKYPFVRCKDPLTPLPRAIKNVSFSVWALWKPNNWKYVELVDSRDGKLLVLAGQSSRRNDFVIYYGLSRTNQYMQIPRLTLLNEPNVRLVTAALVPDDESHQFSIIALARRGQADSKIKPDSPASEAFVVRFTSLDGSWGNPVTTLFPMPTKKMLRLGSILSEKKLHFLHPNYKVITVDITSLELGTINLPKVTNIGSWTSHVLSRSPRSKTLYLAIVCQRCIAMYSYDGNDWEQKQLFPSPGHAKFVALKIVGSTDFTGQIFVKADGRLIYKMDVLSGSFNLVADNVPEEEVLPYELEFPPVSQMLRQQPHVH